MKEFENETTVENIIDNTMDKIKNLMETNTIVGEPVISPDGTVIIPISKVSVGFVVGGGEYSEKMSKFKAGRFPMAGGSGGGMTLTPVGFLVETSNSVKFIDIENKTAYESVVNLVNSIIDKMGDK